MKGNQASTPELRSIFASAARMLCLVWRASRWYCLATLALTAITAVVPPAQIWLTKMIIDGVADATAAGAPRDMATWYVLLSPVAGVFLVWVGGGLCQSLNSHVRELMAVRTRIHVECLILGKTNELDAAFYEIPAMHDRLSRANGQSFHVHNFTINCVEFLARLMSLGALLGLLANLHPLAVAVLLLTAAPLTFILAWSANQQWNLLHDQTPARRMSRYVHGLLASRGAFKEARLFGLHDRFLTQFRRFWLQHFEDERRIRLAAEGATMGLFLLAMAGVAGIWLYAIVQAAHGRISLGEVALAFQASERSRALLAQMFLGVGRFYEICVFVDNLFEFLDMDPGSVDGALARGGHYRVPAPIEKEIEFRNVSFRYPGEADYVLRDLSFCLCPDEAVALVGENGAGKTTLVKLLARFYDPTQGEILADGRDLREFDVLDWHRHVGVIFQDFLRYHLTVRENIGFGQVESVDDRGRVAAAAEKGGAAALIDGLPCGYETVLGKMAPVDQGSLRRRLPGGSDLSGGEWQKIALSRAFMRDSQVLILDEPTAALDALAEYEVYRRFAELTGGRTTVFISHRFSTVRMADRILVLRSGRLAEQGTHEELVALNGHYASMFEAQAERYRD